MRIATETKIPCFKVERAFRLSFSVIPSEVEESLDNIFSSDGFRRQIQAEYNWPSDSVRRYIMQRIVFIFLAAHVSLLTGDVIASDQPQTEEEVVKLKREYADVLALTGTAKGEILAVAKILRANPRIAIDQTAASGEYCFNSGLGTMVHFATEPERTPEDVVYEFDASALISAGLDPSRLQQLPERREMKPGVWYFLPKGQQDPHHAHAMANPTIAIAINVK